MKTATFNAFFVLFALSLLGLSACSGVQREAKYPTGADRASTGGENNIYDKQQSVFGKDGLQLFGNKKKDNNSGDSGIGVNSFLWRASLDTVSFMPLASADPFGGTILTDWYSPEDKGDERFKINVFIMGRELRSDGVRVRVFRQTMSKKGEWVEADIASNMDRQLEDAILTRARQLRVAQMEKDD